MGRHITLWRKLDNPIDWDFYVSEDMQEAEDVVANLVKQGIKRFTTFPIGDRVADLSFREGLARK